MVESQRIAVFPIRKHAQSIVKVKVRRKVWWHTYQNLYQRDASV